jgi:adenine-specific DNA-methyltransferase
MSKEILQDIIDSFSPDKFSRFFRDKNRSFSPRQEDVRHYDDENFKNGLKLGEIQFSKTEKLIVCAFQVKQSLSERSGKKAQYEKGKKILKDTQSDAGIFIFYDSTGNFRFSLIYPETIGNRRQWSSFRRFTYFVSRELTNKTFLQRIGDNKFSSIEKIKDAFSVEKVTKEFYLEYRKLFERLVKDLSSNHTFINEAVKNDINTENFAKKLLGQIVFIYFIQKKGWMGVPSGQNWGSGDKNFLINQFKEAIGKKSNFFNDNLEFLFYGILNNPRRNSADPSFSKEFNSRIPFLNGGLFEAEYDWQHSFIYLDNNIFKNIFDVFERFNFTVEEESPDDKEIAVDPEMLGKVFENLLPENLRKGTGTYYTPREIVYYMCQESLVSYLDSNSKMGKEKAEKCVKSLKDGESFISDKEAVEIDALLENIKICDPACGSGAFLVGMLNEIVRLRLLLRVLYPTKLSRKPEYQLKKDTIHNCVYGVDIDPGAIEIAKLRLWLTLVVDYEIRDIEPLPNLDYRLMCGNSLLEEFEGARFYNGDGEMQDLGLFKDTKKQEKISELKNMVEEYFDIHDDEKKRNKRKEINDIKDWLIKTALEKRRKELARHRKSEESKLNMFNEESRKKYFEDWGTKFLAESKINEVLRNLHDPRKAKPFFIWKLEFIDVFEDKGGFDVVIANPPYIKEDVNKQAFDGLRMLNCYQGKMDIWYLFGAKSIDILAKKGVITFIATNNWITNDGASKFRNKIINQCRIVDYLDFGDYKVFSAGIQTMVFVLNKDAESQSYVVNYGRLLNNDADQEVLSSFLLSFRENINENYEKYNVKINRCEFINSYINFIRPNISSILNNMMKIGSVSLSDNEIFSGIDITQDFVIKSHLEKLKGDFIVGQGIFVLSDFEKKQIKWNENELNLIKPYYTTQEISRYHANAKNQYWIIYAGTTINRNIKLYPNIRKHLDRFQKVITSVNKPYGIHRTRDEDIFLGTKIFSIRKCAKPSFSLVDFPCYVSRPFLIIKTTKIDMKTLVAILNSRLTQFWLLHKGKLQGNQLQVDKVPLMSIPLAVPKQSKEASYAELVLKIMTLKKTEDHSQNITKQKQVKECEHEINQMVYKLYGLTKEEIDIIEKSIS